MGILGISEEFPEFQRNHRNLRNLLINNDLQPLMFALEIS